MTLPTPTIVRIKRKAGSESSESIIVSTKRKRLNEEETDENPLSDICTAIFKKLTTLKKGDSLEVETRKALANEPKHSWNLKENYKKGFHSTAKELVRKKKSDVAAIRFKLICSKRKIEEIDDSQSDRLQFNMFDALKEQEEIVQSAVASSSKIPDADSITCNGIPMESEKVEYVYDLYYTSLPLELSSWIDNICEIQKCNAIEYGETRSSDDDRNNIDDDDDENSESNWRNDYPDEEEATYFEDEDEYLCAELTKKANLSDSSESYDVEDYDESGDFDSDGNVILYNEKPSNSVFGLPKRKTRISSSSGSDE